MSKLDNNHLIAEFNGALQESNHLDNIGWVIFSFFLIFMGSLIAVWIGFSEEVKNIHIGLKVGIIVVTMWLGFVVERLLIKSQNKKHEKEILANKLRAKLNLDYKEIKSDKTSLWIHLSLWALLEALLILLFALS